MIAAPRAEAIMFEMNLDRSIGGIQTAVIGWIAGQDAEKSYKVNFGSSTKNRFFFPTSKHETQNCSQNDHGSQAEIGGEWSQESQHTSP